MSDDSVDRKKLEQERERGAGRLVQEFREREVPRVRQRGTGTNAVLVQHEIWEPPPSAVVAERPPERIPEAKTSAVESRIALGRAVGAGEKDAEPLTIGLDFGTSSSKVVVRQEGARHLKTGIPAPDGVRSEGQTFLWQTVVWSGSNGEFRAVPDPDGRAKPVTELKQGLMRQGGKATDGVDATLATAAYLALVIRHTLGWLAENGVRSGSWTANIGAPAKLWGETPETVCLREVLAMATRLVRGGQELVADNLKAVRREPVVREAVSSADEALETLGIGVVPDIVGAAASVLDRVGIHGVPHLIIDTGAMTVDVGMVRVRLSTAGDPVTEILGSDVDMVGVDALRWWREAGKTEDQLRTQIRRMVENVLVRGKPSIGDASFSRLGGRRLPLLMLQGQFFLAGS